MLAVILSITLLVYPRSSVVAIVYLAGIVLLIVGIEKVITGLFVRQQISYGKRRFRDPSNHTIADSNGVSDVNQHIPDIPTRSGAFDIRNS